MVAGLHRGCFRAARAHGRAWDFCGGQGEWQDAAFAGHLGDVNTDGTLFFEGLSDDFGEFCRWHCGYT